MADEISVPIKLPTDASQVSDARNVVAGLQAALKALGPAAAAGSAQAKSELRGLANAVRAAQKEARGGGGQTPGVDVNAKQFKTAERQRSAAQKQIQREMLAARKKQAAEDAKNQKGLDAISADKAIGFAASASLGVMAALTAAAGALAVKFSLLTIQAQVFKESTLGAFSKLLGGAKQADAAFKATIKTADAIGMSYEDALRGVNSLIAKGFKADQAQDLVKAMADLKSVVPDANIGNLLLAITQIKSKGVLQMEELQGQIAEAGLSVSVVLEEIGKSIGKSAADVRKMIGAGKISADQGVQGILAAIQKTTGKPIGKAAEEASKSLGGLLSRLEQIPGGLFLMADASKGVTILKDALSNLVGAFAPSTKGGQALSASLGRLADAFAGVFSGLTGKEGGSTLEKLALGIAGVIDLIASGAKKLSAVVGPAFGAFIKGFADGLSSGTAMGKNAGDNTATFERLGKAIVPVAEALGTVAGYFLATATAIQSVSQTAGGLTAILDSQFMPVLGITQMITNAAIGAFTAAQGIGTNLVQGIIAGITLASPALGLAVQGLMAMTTGTAQGAAKIKSPSKLWRDEIGYQLPAGAAEGIDQGAPVMAKSASTVMGDTTQAAQGAGGNTTIARPNGPVNVTINIHGGDRSVKTQVIEALHEVFGEVSYA